jgi:hypothetical protein
MDIRLALMSGTDIPIPECQLTLHQPTIKEISFMGEEDFFKGVQCLCLHRSMFMEDKDALSNINNFQIFMTMMMDKETVDKKNSVLQLLTILFPKYKVMITPRSIILKDEAGLHIIDEKDFESF